MDAHHHILFALHIPFDDGKMAFAVQRALIGFDAEMAVLAREVHIRDLADKGFRSLPVSDQRLHGDDLQLVRLGEFQKLRRPHHVTVVGHDLAAKSRRIKPRQLRKIDGRLRVPGSPKHAARHRPEREHMTGAAETRRLRRWIDQKPHRLAPLESGNARVRRHRVHGNGKRRLMIVRIVRDHRRDVEGVEPVTLHRRADQPLRIGCHEVDRLRRDLVRRDNQVALVFPVLVVDDHQHFPLPDVFDGVLHSRKAHFFPSVFLKIHIFAKTPPSFPRTAFPPSAPDRAAICPHISR